MVGWLGKILGIAPNIHTEQCYEYDLDTETWYEVSKAEYIANRRNAEAMALKLYKEWERNEKKIFG